MELKIAVRVAEELGVGVEALHDRSMKHKVVHTRYFFWYVLYYATPLSMPEIGALLGYHHTTILHGIQSVRNNLKRADRAAKIINEFYQAPVPAHMQLALEFS